MKAPSKTYQSRVAERNRWQRWHSHAEDGEQHQELDLWTVGDDGQKETGEVRIWLKPHL